MTGREQARLLGLFFWIFSGIQLLAIGAIAIVMVLYFSVLLAVIPHKASDPPPEVILPIMIVIMAIVLGSFLLFSIPKIIAGYGLRKEKSWARIWAIIASIMACMSFPVGTALGVFGLVFLFGDAGRQYFDSPEYGRLPATAGMKVTPPPNSWQ
jgi:hypothetical protein